MTERKSQTTRTEDEWEPIFGGPEYGHLEGMPVGVQRKARQQSATEDVLHAHVEQRIQERLNMGHLYTIEDGPDGPEACSTGRAAASLRRVVWNAVQEAGWRIVK